MVVAEKWDRIGIESKKEGQRDGEVCVCARQWLQCVSYISADSRTGRHSKSCTRQNCICRTDFSNRIYNQSCLRVTDRLDTKSKPWLFYGGFGSMRSGHVQVQFIWTFLRKYLLSLLRAHSVDGSWKEAEVSYVLWALWILMSSLTQWKASACVTAWLRYVQPLLVHTEHMETLCFLVKISIKTLKQDKCCRM